mgnify:FL=1
MINDFLDNLAAEQYLKMHNEKELITEVESDRYMRKKGKRKNSSEGEIFEKEDYCEGEFIPGFHD